MKLKLAIISAAVTTTLMASSALAADGTINFEGALTANTCDITVDGKPSPATVTLPTVTASALLGEGATAGDTLFKIVLTNCEGVSGSSTAAAFFEAGSTVDNKTFNLINTDLSEDGAKNVQLQLLDAENQSPINVGFSNQKGKSTRHSIASEQAEMPYTVRYYSLGSATAGLVQSQVNFSIDYE